jgi:L-iditol 2-dehydrogenase
MDNRFGGWLRVQETDENEAVGARATKAFEADYNRAMLVAELTGLRMFTVSEHVIQDPGFGEVQIRLGAVGVCGSDLHSYAEGGMGDMRCEYPMVLGHEPAGTVARIGAGVTGWSVGDRIVIEPALYCYHCEFCRTGHHNVCSNIRFPSNPGIPGFFRQFANVPAANLIPVPPNLSLELAALFEPLAVVLHSMNLARMRPGETAVVIGAGPIGLLTAGCLKAVGAGPIWVIEPVRHRRDIALSCGADVVLDPAEVDVERQILADTKGRGVDCAFDCAATQDTTNLAIRSVRNSGRLILTGIHSEVFVPFEVSPMRRKELVLFIVRRSNHTSDAALSMLANSPERFGPLLTHSRRIEQISEAFSMAEQHSDGVVKMIIT